jgi:hypothetical protein
VRAQEYANHSSHIVDHGKDSAGKLGDQESLNQAGRELRELLRRFANGTDPNIIWDAANVLVQDSRNDPELREWFTHVDAYIRKTLLEPGFVLEPACNNEANTLREQGRRFYDDKYQGHFNNFFDSVGTFFSGMGASHWTVRR